MSRTKSTLLAIVSRYFGMAVTAVVSFTVVPVILRYISKADYGLWITMGEVMAYLAVLDFGTGAAVSRMAARLRNEADAGPLSRLVSTALWVNAAFAVIFVLAGTALLLVLPAWKAIPPDRLSVAKAILLIMVARGALSFPIRVAANTLVGLQMQAFVNLLNAAGIVLAPVIYLVLLRRDMGVAALPVGILAGTVITSLPTFLLLKHAVPALKFGFTYVSWKEARQLFRWSSLFFLNNIAVIVIYYTDNVVIASRIDLASVARFTLTSNLLLYWQPLLVAVSDSAIPACVELYKLGELERLKTIFLQIMRVTLGAAFCVAVTAGVFNRDFVGLWVGGTSYGGNLLTLVFAFVLIHRTAMQVSSVVVISTGRIRGVAIMSMVEAALNLALSLLLAKPLGILGVALGTAIASLGTSGWYVPRVLLQETRTSLLEYLRECWTPPLLAGSAALAAAALLRIIAAPMLWPALIASAGIVALVYAGVFGMLEFQRGDWRKWVNLLKISAVLGR